MLENTVQIKTGAIKNSFDQNIRFQKEQNVIHERRNRLGVELPCSINLSDYFQVTLLDVSRDTRRALFPSRHRKGH